jgi:hypothetical protein
MANIEVDPATLAKDGDEFNNIAAVARSISAALARGARLITFPEDDEVSRAFSEGWNALIGGATRLFDGFGDGMTKVSGNVYDTAALYAKSNEVNTESVIAPPTVHR